jgi:hypothetical protein
MNDDIENMTKLYETHIEDGTVYVDADVGQVEVGPYQDLINRFGEEYEIEYSDWEKKRYDISFADEGMTINLRETVEAMTHSEAAVQWLREKSTEAEPDGFFDGGLRMALFTGFVNEALRNGPR